VPTYQYACTDCAERIEVVQKFTDEPLLVCTLCGGRLRKVFSPVGIVFKGSGFYRNDSRAGAKKDKVLNGAAENGSGSASSPDSGSSSDAKSGGESSGDKKADKSAAGTSPGSGSSSDSGSSSGSGSSSSSSGKSSSGKSSSSSSGSKVA
jgi:putative FmdB family regulatory protein